jgi:hypothetical protein
MLQEMKMPLPIDKDILVQGRAYVTISRKYSIAKALLKLN